MIVSRYEYRGQNFQINYDAKDPAYTVTFANFPEIITSGPTLPKAFANACEALNLHLESLLKLGLPIPAGGQVASAGGELYQAR